MISICQILVSARFSVL